MLNITEPGGQEAPFAAIILNEEASQLVVALRGTMLPGEWALDFSYKCAGWVLSLLRVLANDPGTSASKQPFPGLAAGAPVACQAQESSHFALAFCLLFPAVSPCPTALQPDRVCGQPVWFAGALRIRQRV